MRIFTPSSFPAPSGDERQAEQEIRKQSESLAEEVLSIAKGQLLVKLRFLDRALFELKLQPCDTFSLATDGQHLLYQPLYLLKLYRQEQTSALRILSHALMHSLFRHMFILGSNLDPEYWNLSCDIAAESMVRELQIRQLVESERQPDRNQALDFFAHQVGTITAEKLYRYFQAHPPTPTDMALWLDLFNVDDHSLWYLDPEPGQKDDLPKEEPSNQEKASEKAPSMGSAQASSEQNLEEEPVSGASPVNPEPQPSQTLTHEQQQLEAMWKDISEHVQTDLETFAKQQGIHASGMEQALRSLNRERYDYTAFLRKFATMHEVMKLSPDEFDQIFYTYGLSLYRDMPLVEPLEYREDKRIHDFVIAIDTSGSVAGDLVQMFLQKTYNILMQEESFERRFQIHIIQCDAEIQEDVLITSREDFQNYLREMKLYGFGGTDFRPVFEYVEKLRKNQQLRNLKGLLYFTDGYGIYPSRQTDYQTAFVFLDQDADGQYQVPPWAIRVILETEDLKKE